jgi:hypothetical protein
MKPPRKDNEEVTERMNLPSGFWYEIWSQVIATAWSALREEEDLKKGRKADALKARIGSDTFLLFQELPSKKGEAGRRKIDWEFLVTHKFVTGPEPLNFPDLHIELVEDGRDGNPGLSAQYMQKNAFRNINGWVQDLVELGGQATIRVPDHAAIRPNQRTKALDWYVKQGFHMPFAPNNQLPFTPGKVALNASSALGFSGGRIGEESASDALDCDSEWFGVFPQILAFAWHSSSHCDRLTQRAAKRRLRRAHGAAQVGAIREQMIRERDALFAEFGYRRPVGLEVDFEFVKAKYSEEYGWDFETLKPTLVVRIPPPPADVAFHPIALADYRATGKAQLFTT